MTALTPAATPSRQVIKKALPKVVCDIEGVAATANTAITGASTLTPSDTPCTWRVQVCMDNTAQFGASITVGATARTSWFKPMDTTGLDLVANASYIFDLLVHAGDTVSFLTNENGNILNLRVQELIWGGN